MKLIVAVVAVVAILLIASMAVLFWPKGDDNGSETIGSRGGVLSITSGALDGLRIEVPSGASESPVNIDVTSEVVDDLPGLPSVGSIASRLITINTDGSDSWNVFKMFDNASPSPCRMTKIWWTTRKRCASTSTTRCGTTSNRPGSYPRTSP